MALNIILMSEYSLFRIAKECLLKWFHIVHRKSHHHSRPLYYIFGQPNPKFGVCRGFLSIKEQPKLFLRQNSYQSTPPRNAAINNFLRATKCQIYPLTSLHQGSNHQFPQIDLFRSTMDNTPPSESFQTRTSRKHKILRILIICVL